MTALRILTRRYRSLALALVVLALAMKALVPGGFMIRNEGRVVTIAICDGRGDQAQVEVEVPAKPGDKSGEKSGPVCAFSALSAGALGVDTALLSALLLFIAAAGLLPAPAPSVRRSAHLRPPLRGPPIIA